MCDRTLRRHHLCCADEPGSKIPLDRLERAETIGQRLLAEPSRIADRSDAEYRGSRSSASSSDWRGRSVRGRDRDRSRDSMRRRNSRAPSLRRAARAGNRRRSPPRRRRARTSSGVRMRERLRCRGPRLFARLLAVNHRCEAVTRRTMNHLPHVEHAAASRVHEDAPDVRDKRQFFGGDAERGEDHHVVGMDLRVSLRRIHRARGQDDDGHLAKARVVVAVLDDLAGQEDPPVGKTMPGFVSVLYRPVDPVANPNSRASLGRSSPATASYPSTLWRSTTSLR